MNTTRNRADPIVTEIVRNGALAVTNEMKTNLMRTAYNTIIYEALDFTTGLFTADGRTVSIGLGLPTFIRGMAATIKAFRDHFGDDIAPGDILVTNNSYTTGSHLNHVTLGLPIFHDGRIAGYACTMAHWEDIGGVLGGVTTDIFSEGLQIPILKLYREGQPNRDLIELIRMNCRIEEKAMGDLRAEVTAVKTGERRFLELLNRYGQTEVLGAIDDIMDHSEAKARARTLAIPDGVYEAESYMDDDAIDVGRKVPIKIKVTKSGEEMTIDLSDVSRQVRGFYNSAATTGQGCTQVAYKCLTSPTDYPINDGSFRSPHLDRAGRPRDLGQAPGAHAPVDDLPDDHHRHGVQGDGAGHAGPGDRRPPRRPDLVQRERNQPRHRAPLPRRARPAGRRLGRQARRGRRFGDGLPQ